MCGVPRNAMVALIVSVGVLINVTGAHQIPPVESDAIVFDSERDGNMEIYVMNVDGSDLRNLTLNGARDAHPNW